MNISHNEPVEEFYDHEKFQQDIIKAFQTHQQFIIEFQKKKFPEEYYQLFAEFDIEVRNMFKHATENPTVYLGKVTVRDVLNQKFKHFKAEISERIKQDERNKRINMENQRFEESSESQNLHPNMFKQNFDENKLEISQFEESSISNAEKFYQKTPNKSPFTPESVSRVYHDHKSQMELSERPSFPANPQNINPKYSNNTNVDNEDAQNELIEEIQEEMKLDIKDRLVHKKWQVRKNSYEEIAQMFEKAANGEVFQEYGPNDAILQFNPLERYQEWLIRMIRDSNLSAQQEGLKTLLVYLKASPDIRSAMLSTLPDLLDKINNKKANFSKITTEIIEVMFERGMGAHIVPELLKRFKNARNDKITIFSIDILRSIIEKDVYMDIINLRHLFNGISTTLINPDNHIRDAGINLLKEMFIRIADDVPSIIKKLRNLRPVLKKQIRADLEQLSKQEGCEEHRIFPPLLQKQTLETEESCDNAHEQIQEEMKMVDISQENVQKDNQDEGVDLNSLAPEDFDKLNYVNQIKKKKDVLTEFRKKLEKVEVLAKGNSYKVYNSLTSMLEDTNALIFQEASKIVEILANLKDEGIKAPSKYSKKFVELLIDRFKENKTNVSEGIRNALDAFIQNEIIPVSQLVEIALTLDGNKTVKNKKVIVSSTKSKACNPRTKQSAIEYIRSHLGGCNMAMQNSYGMNDFQISVVQGVINSRFEKPLLLLLTKETNNGVREEAYNLLKEIKKAIELLGQDAEFVDEAKRKSVDEIIFNLPKK